MQERRVPIGIAFQEQDADLLVNDIEVGDGAVVGGVHLVLQRRHAHFIFVLAGFRLGHLEFDRQLLKLLRVDMFGLDDLPLAQQLHGQVLQLAADQPEGGVDARLLFDIGIGLKTGDADGHVARLALPAQGHGINGRLAVARQRAGLHRIDEFKIMSVCQ